MKEIKLEVRELQYAIVNVENGLYLPTVGNIEVTQGTRVKLYNSLIWANAQVQGLNNGSRRKFKGTYEIVKVNISLKECK
jgi:hypothetical protein